MSAKVIVKFARVLIASPAAKGHLFGIRPLGYSRNSNATNVTENQPHFQHEQLLLVKKLYLLKKLSVNS